MGKIDWDLWGVHKEQRKIFGCGYASDPMDRQPEIICDTIYRKWSIIMFHCKSVLKEEHTNIDFSICKEWLDFSRFKRWYQDNYYEIEGEEIRLYANLLDLDSTEYSPNTSVFAPRSLASVINDGHKYNDMRSQYNLPKWVRMNIKDGRNTGFGGQVTFTFMGGKKKTVYVPHKPNPLDAYNLCKFYKELSFIHMAYQYRGSIDNRLFDAILKYRANDDGKLYVDKEASAISLYQIGYIKPDDFPSISIEEIESVIFKCWINIIYEVYNGKSYICEAWKDYFNFKKWWEESRCEEIEDMSRTYKIFNTLYDKDNILYSPDTTVLLSYNLYILVYNQTQNNMCATDKTIPQGISKIYGKTKVSYKVVVPYPQNTNGKYRVGTKNIKTCDTLEEAVIEYVNYRQKYKEMYLNKKGIKYIVKPKLYQALLAYEIDIPTVDNWEDEDGEEDYIEC